MASKQWRVLVLASNGRWKWMIKLIISSWSFLSCFHLFERKKSFLGFMRRRSSFSTAAFAQSFSLWFLDGEIPTQVPARYKICWWCFILLLYMNFSVERSFDRTVAKWMPLDEASLEILLRHLSHRSCIKKLTCIKCHQNLFWKLTWIVCFNSLNCIRFA